MMSFPKFNDRKIENFLTSNMNYILKNPLESFLESDSYDTESTIY